MRKALFPGSFNPFTIGHQSIVERGLALFDQIVIGVGINADKNNIPETAVRRAEGISRVFASEPRVTVTTYTGLTVDAARIHGCGFILRGVRSAADFEYERTLADVNRNISGIESVLLYALPELASVSSSVVRDLQRHGYDVSRFLPSQLNR